MSLSPSLLAFLRDLRVNNTREWFAENKAVYEQEKKGFDAWTTELITEFADFENMDGVLLKHCSYRHEHAVGGLRKLHDVLLRIRRVRYYRSFYLLDPREAVDHLRVTLLRLADISEWTLHE